MKSRNSTKPSSLALETTSHRTSAARTSIFFRPLQFLYNSLEITPNSLTVNMCKQTNFALFAIALSASCAPSSAPDIREIIITNQPTFDGLTYKKYTTPSEKFTLSGECDPISYSLQSSSDGKSWQTLPGSCPSGKFSIDLNVARITSVFVRAQTKTGFTPASEAVVRHLFPPTSPLFTLVASSQSGDIGTGAPQMQTTMALSYTGAPLSNGSQNLQFYLPGVVYAP